MRVFVDACVDPGVVEILVGHEAQTAFDVGRQNLKDHILLPKIAAEFDVLLTNDLHKLTLGIVIAHVARNKLADYRAIALRTVKAGEVLHVRADA